MCLINGISIGSFAIPRTDVGDRLGVSMTMVLTAVAFKLEISNKLPDLSYLTLLDKFVLASFGFIGAISVENTLALYWLDDSQDETLLYVFCYTWLIGTVFTILVIAYKILSKPLISKSPSGRVEMGTTGIRRGSHIGPKVAPE